MKKQNVAEPENPYIFVDAAGREIKGRVIKTKLLQSRDAQRAVLDGKPSPLPHGPVSAGRDEGLTPLTYCIKYAVAEDWTALQKTVAARVAKEPREVWWRCNKCGLSMPRAFRAAPGGQCIKCNWPNYADGGQMVKMTPDEVRIYKTTEAVRKAEVHKRDAAAALWAMNQERGKSGLLPWTRAEYDANERAERMRRAEDERRVRG